MKLALVGVGLVDLVRLLPMDYGRNGATNLPVSVPVPAGMFTSMVRHGSAVGFSNTMVEAPQ